MLNILHTPNTTGQKSIVLSSILHRYSKVYIRSYRKRETRGKWLHKNNDPQIFQPTVNHIQFYLLSLCYIWIEVEASEIHSL